MPTPRPRRPERSLSVDAPVLDAPVRAVVGTAARAPPRTTLSTEAQSGAEKGCDPKAISGHQHAIRCNQMQSECNQHAISMQSACNQKGCDPKAMRKRGSLAGHQGLSGGHQGYSVGPQG